MVVGSGTLVYHLQLSLHIVHDLRFDQCHHWVVYQLITNNRPADAGLYWSSRGRSFYAMTGTKI